MATATATATTTYTMRKTTALLLGVLLYPSVSANQLVLQSESPPVPQALSMVSLLSLSPNHSMTLHLLQRAKLIPTLNMMENATFFAPTDRAWELWAERQRGSDDSWLGSASIGEWLEQDGDSSHVGQSQDSFMADNQNWALRQHLLYHLLNYTLSAQDILPLNSSSGVPNVSTHETLHFPYLKAPEPSPEPPSGPPWLPRGDTGKGLLGGDGQRLRLLRGSAPEADSARVGVDWKGEGGVLFWDGSGWENRTDRVETAKKGHRRKEEKVRGVRWASNGAVVGIDDVLEPPPSIGKTSNLLFQTDVSCSFYYPNQPRTRLPFKSASQWKPAFPLARFGAVSPSDHFCANRAGFS